MLILEIVGCVFLALAAFNVNGGPVSFGWLGALCFGLTTILGVFH